MSLFVLPRDIVAAVYPRLTQCRTRRADGERAPPLRCRGTGLSATVRHDIVTGIRPKVTPTQAGIEREMKIAVVTDAVSANAYFPVWHAYYGGQFGARNIYVFTYAPNAAAFAEVQLGGLQLIGGSYNDDLRKDAITSFVCQLLESYEVVIRVDVDEFLVPDPLNCGSLAERLGNWSGTHITACGFDIFQTPGEPPLDFKQPLLAQRSTAYALTALNKTCVTRVPVKWNRGFHYCSLPPEFADVYLLHTKRADIRQQIAWNERMRSGSDQDEFVKSYYAWDAQQIETYHRNRAKLPLVSDVHALTRTDFNEQFKRSVRYAARTQIFDGPYEVEPVNVEIPERFLQFF
jgi:hypothetical protein